MKALLTALLVALATGVKAQVTFQPVIPAVGVIQKTQLWNILVINGSADNFTCRFDLVVKDRTTNTDVFTASTNTFSLGTGALQVNANTLNPIQYNYAASGFNTKIQGLIPVGNYLACYSLLSIGGKVLSLAEECIPFDVEPLSPPMLISPADSSVLDVAPAQFSWVPPSPDGMFNRLNYDVIITQINEGQKAEEAIQQNLPLYNQNNLPGNFLTYSNTYSAFEKDKWYAWQVVARDDYNYAGKTETWVFKINAGSVPVPGNANYVVLGTEENGKGISNAVNGEVNIQFHSYDKDYIAEINLVAPGGKLIKRIRKKVMYGDNFFTIKANNGFVKGRVYSIELKGLDGRKYAGLVRIAE